MKTRDYVVQQWWSFDGTYAVWRRLRPFGSVLVYRGRNRDVVQAVADSLNRAHFRSGPL